MRARWAPWSDWSMTLTELRASPSSNTQKVSADFCLLGAPRDARILKCNRMAA